MRHLFFALLIITAFAEISSGCRHAATVVDDDSSNSDVDVDTEASVKPACEGSLDFPDAYLKKAVHEAIEKPGEEILYSDATELTSLTAENKAISDLKGIECLTNLVYLDLSDNEISDLTELSHLTHLTSLNLQLNRVSDLTQLSHMNGLTYLKLYSNLISDITALTNLTNLDYLDLNDNRISDITPLIENQGIDEGDQVTIVNNSLDCRDATTQKNLINLVKRNIYFDHDCN